MRVESIIKLLEDLAFEILSWIWYFPYTLIRSLAPGGAHRIVAEQYAQEDQRSENALSPLVYYFVVFVLLGAFTDPSADLSLERFADLAQLELLIAALSILALPFLFTLPFWWWASWKRKRKLQKAHLRRMFEVQVLLWPTYFAANFLGFKLWGALDPSRETFGWLFTVVLLAGTLYFLFLEGWALLLDLVENEPTPRAAAFGGLCAMVVIIGILLGLSQLTDNLFAPFEELLRVGP